MTEPATGRTDGFLPIEDYGLIGNLETCALVGRDGSVDWFPSPHQESPSRFAAILDADDGGRFALRPTSRFDATRRYDGATPVLETTFDTAAGRAALTDFMLPVESDATDAPSRAIYRRASGRGGSVELDCEFLPRFDYARREPSVEVDATQGDALVRATAGDEEAVLWSDADPTCITRTAAGAGASATVSLEAGDTRWFVCSDGDTPVEGVDPCEEALAATRRFWEEWAHDCVESECVFGGPWHDLVTRSDVVLKLLSHHESGAIAAAPTTSLPEDVGGVRNWDYRYSWLRDGAFTVQALSNLGHVDEVRSYVEWFLDICHADDPANIQPLYGLHGDTDLEERELPHLSGYRASTPVRIGNKATDQRQLDIYGELLLAVDELVRHGESIDDEDWRALRDVVEYVTDVWDEPDAGIWEVRCEPEHFVHSKVLCWTALDRGIAIAEMDDHEAPLERWRESRAAIRTAILGRGIDDERGCFVRAFDEPGALDAATLLIPFVGFLPFDDPRVEATIRAIDERLTTADGLVYRYDGADGLPGEEGVFLLCTFWLIDALALTGRREAARERLEHVLEFVTPLGLLAEEVDRETGAHLGNFPQAFSHVGLINAALYLACAGGEASPGVEPLGLDLGEGTTVPEG